MNSTKIKLFLLFYFILNISNSAQAYIDPATGTLLIQILAAIFAGIITFFTSFINKVKLIFSKIKNFFKKKKIND